MTFDQLPESWQREVKQLRAEVAKHRIRAKENHAAKQQLDAVKAVLAMNTATQGDRK